MSIRGVCILALAVLVGRDFSPVGPNFLVRRSSQSEGGSSATQQPTFKSGVQMIEVDVRVFARDGRFVSDLALADFEVLENGVVQNLKTLFLVGNPVGPNFSSASGEAGLKSRPTDVTPESARQTWIFFFDLNHLTPGGGFDRARKAVGDFVQNRFREGDMAGVIAGDKMVNNRLTSVREELATAVKQVKPSNESRSLFIQLRREWPRFQDEDEAIRASRNERDVIARVVGRACAQEPDSCRGVDVESIVRSKAIMLQQQIHKSSNQTMATLYGLASGLAKIPGPKTVVFLSDGFVVQDVETTLHSVVGQTARAGGRVYAIDVRGLARGVDAGNVDQMLTDDPYFATTKFDNQADGPNSLAVDTGGVMIRNENNIGRALDAVARDSGRYYVLGYQPTNTNFDGTFRPIEVRVKRDGVRVRARRGYLALDPAQLTLPQPIKSPGR
jgi:VWFA-related protein